jgi:methyltransferase (TIGR00027 family)
MKAERSSQSAMGVAVMRAIEATRPAAVRICDDPLARALSPTGLYLLTKAFIDSGLYARMAPGAVEFIIGRERYIDDFLAAALAQGLEQLVLLGAGFDTRAYRVPGVAKTRVFEVDHPATQAVKLEKLKKIVNPLPANVTLVPVDFNTQALGDRLLSSGYDAQAKTLFIWQGVTYFLTAEGVDNTLAFIAHHSGPGSAVIFDYFFNEELRDPHSAYAKAMRRSAQLTGEQYLFRIDRDQIEAFLAQRGFRDVCSVTLEQVKQRYFTGPNARRPMPAGVAIASAVVQKAGGSG